MLSVDPLSTIPISSFTDVIVVVVNNNVFFILVDIEITKIVSSTEVLEVDQSLSFFDIIARIENI